MKTVYEKLDIVHTSNQKSELTKVNSMNQSSHPQHLTILVRVQTRRATTIQERARNVPFSAFMSTSLLASIEYWGKLMSAGRLD